MPKPSLHKYDAQGNIIISPRSSKDTRLALHRQYIDRMLPLPVPTPDQIGFSKEDHDKLSW